MTPARRLRYATLRTIRDLSCDGREWPGLTLDRHDCDDCMGRLQCDRYISGEGPDAGCLYVSRKFHFCDDEPAKVPEI